MKGRTKAPDQPSAGAPHADAHTAATEAFDHRSAEPSGDSAALDRLLAQVLVPEAQRLSFAGEVARGGMGTVELVIDRQLQRRMARKVLHATLRDRLEAVRWFLREAQITAQLDHPAIAPIHHLGVDDRGRLSFTMKLIEGETLAARVAPLGDRARDWETTFDLLEIVGKVCDALAFAHSRGVVHGDVKPENVLLGPFGQVYLMDWGLARPGATREAPARDAVTTSIEAAAHDGITGTPAYMAPEQARGEATDERIDVFAVGALLYFALSSRPPYPGASAAESWELARGAKPRPLHELAARGSIPPELCRIVSTAMAEDPSQRYQSVAELRSDLNRFLRGGEGFPQQRVAAGEHIVREGEPADAAYVLVSGRALIYRTVGGEKRVLREVGAGDVFGEMALLTRSVRTASIEALEDCLLTVLSRDVFEREVDAMKPWMSAFARTLAARFRELEQASEGRASEGSRSS
jgi:serine/threonine-protein kinase